MVSQSETDFAGLRREDVVWIDLFAPTGDEKRAVEAFLGTEIQSRATAEEIEARWEEDVKNFLPKRAKYLIYE